MVPGGDAPTGATSAAPGPASDNSGGGLANALQEALNKRNKKVSASGKFVQCSSLNHILMVTDDEDDNDDWD